MTLSFDIESVGVDPVSLDEETRVRLVRDYGDPDAADGDALDRLALSPWTARVVVIACWDDVKDAGVCLVDGPCDAPAPAGFSWLPCADERDLIDQFWRICSARSRFCTFNGGGFDVPFLVARSVVLGVSIHRPLIDSKPWEDTHVDLCDRLKLGWKDRPALDTVCRALGVPSPKDGGIDGSEVGAAWNAGRRLDVARYCCRDVSALALCLERYDASTSGRPPRQAMRGAA